MQTPDSLIVAKGRLGQLLSAEQGSCWKLKTESAGLDKGPISQGTRGSWDLKALWLTDTGVEPLSLRVSWRSWEGWADNTPHPLAQMSLLTWS